MEKWAQEDVLVRGKSQSCTSWCLLEKRALGTPKKGVQGLRVWCDCGLGRHWFDVRGHACCSTQHTSLALPTPE